MGSAIAALVVAFGDLALLYLASGGRRLGPLMQMSIPLVVVAPIVGFVLMYAYVVLRPRLGPGPKTALWTGSLVGAVWTLAFYPLFIYSVVEPRILIFFAVRFACCLIGSYLAGWQYMDGPPE
jgi:hypothetical protein